MVSSICLRTTSLGYYISVITIRFPWLSHSYTSLPNPNNPFYFDIKLVIDVPIMTIFTPLMIQRLHDLKWPVILAVIYWVGVPLSVALIPTIITTFLLFFLISSQYDS